MRFCPFQMRDFDKRYLKRGHRERDGHGLSTEPQPSLDLSSE